MSFLSKFLPPRTAKPPARRIRPQLEALESRLVPYSVSGNAWLNPQLLTVSFVADGTLLSSGVGGNGYNNLNATLNAKYATATWQAEILKGLQLWAQQANINFSVIADNGTAGGQGAYQQGDSGMGDIRIGGLGFSNSYLAGAYYPPAANNYSIAGDINFNTRQSLNINTTYDIQTIAIHEVGHALGLAHSAYSTAIMYGSYMGVKRSLTSDDINGVRAIYGARQQDIYDSVASNDSFATATPLTGLLDPASLGAVVGNLDITTTSDADYYAILAPAGSSGNLTVNVQSSGLSLLRPSVTVYTPESGLLGGLLNGLLGPTAVGSAASPSNQYRGDSLTVNVGGVSEGQLYYVKVSGADNTAFGTGAYALSFSFGNGSLPAVSLPNTLTLNGTPLQGGSGQALDMLSVGHAPDHPLPKKGPPTIVVPPGPESHSSVVASTILANQPLAQEGGTLDGLDFTAAVKSIATAGGGNSQSHGQSHDDLFAQLEDSFWSW